MVQISVIIPCYNYGEFLEEAINSVQRQTFRDFEIIVVNDGSTDKNTIDVLKKIKIKYPEILIINQKNGHLSNARNNGIKSSKGKFILTLDADDVIDSMMLEKCFNIISKDEKLGFVYTKFKFFGDVEETPEMREYNYHDLLKANFIVATSLFRKKAWEEVGGYDEKMKLGCEDWDLWISFGERGWHGKLINETLFFYRKHGVSMIDGTRNNLQEISKYIQKKHKQTYLKENINLKARAFLFKIKYKIIRLRYIKILLNNSITVKIKSFLKN